MKNEIINKGLQPSEPNSEDGYEKAEAAREWVAANFKPNEVFSFYELSEWAKSQGFILVDNHKTY